MARLTFNKLEVLLADNNATWQTDENIFKHLKQMGVPSFSAGVDESVGTEIPMALSSTVVDSFGVAASAVDWRKDAFNKNHISGAKPQGRCSTCVAFSAVAVVEAMISIEQNQSVDLSEGDLAFCSSHGANCNGWRVDEVFEQVKTRGIHIEADFPYDTAFTGNSIWGANPVCRLNTSSNCFYKITHINTVLSIQDTKKYLTHIGPLATTILLFADLDGYRSGIYTPLTTQRGTDPFHAITLIGYNDIEQYWLCKNSWGAGWGENGFVKIAYGTCGIDDTSFVKVGVSGIRQICP